MKKILIVDDETDYLDLLEAMFSQHQWLVTKVDLSIKALELIEMETFDVILSDLNMPQINGIDLICRARVSEKNRSSLTIAMSGFYSKEEVATLSNFAISSFIAKPIQYDVFKAEVEKLLKNKSTSTSSETSQVLDLNLMNEEDA